jgi:hypothetical protein
MGSIRRRLESQFKSHDNEINRYVGIFALIFPASIGMAAWTLNKLEAPNWLIKFATLSIALMNIVGLYVGNYLLSIRIGAKHNLLCVKCGKPFRRGFARSWDPDYRIDGQVPKRCPHCHTSIEEATKRKSSKQDAKQRTKDRTS